MTQLSLQHEAHQGREPVRGEADRDRHVRERRVRLLAARARASVAEVASEEMAEAKKGAGRIHVAMDPLDGSSNISTNNPLGSIFGFYSSTLPCSGEHLVGAAFVTYGPMLTLTFSTGDGVATFVAVGGRRRREFTCSRRS